MQHAKDQFKMAGHIGSTAENLKAAFEGEDHEVTTMYPEFAEQAKAEGDNEAALLFSMIAKVEAHHRDRYKKLLEMVENDTVYTREEAITWKCSKCGHIHEGKQPPGKCPVCKHSREYFEPDDIF